ncbi:hypothetical protein PVK63_09365 [Aliivibrio sp. S2TY2]|uniref:hypothetical protein n=1 Tax=unclassified Aliivibrio TaxID=2645654 RepID=UPI0023792A9D|nr:MULTISPECIES: hypothetical protein [unclassified Aliivibrio]MDD9174894.1 hypothetical protein [Aliivibrio sp. S3TY1]MDD9192159.1 hypothetical protein [Aliivibrio sp. S2TY2]
MACKKVILVGKIPPPFGGVAVSIKNYFDALSSRNEVDVILYSPLEFFKIIFSDAEFVHFNLSRSYKRFLYSLVCFIFKKKVIHTVHGQHFNVKNLFNFFSGKLSHRILVLNKEVYRKLRPVFNNKVFIVSPILKIENLSSAKHKGFKKVNFYPKCILLYSNKRTEIDGKDVYGVDFILSMLSEIKELDYKLVILDLGKDYSFLKEDSQIIYYDSPMNFLDLVASVDIYIRPTSTDGQSIAVLESLSVGTPVLASDSVLRPEACYLYQHESKSEFLKKLSGIKINDNENTYKLTSVDDYLEIIGFKEVL